MEVTDRLEAIEEQLMRIQDKLDEILDALSVPVR